MKLAGWLDSSAAKVTVVETTRQEILEDSEVEAKEGLQVVTHWAADATGATTVSEQQ